MVAENWLPIGFVLSDGARCGKVLHGESDWQIVAADGGGRALIVQEPLRRRWLSNRLIEADALSALPFGATALFAASSSPGQLLAPVNDCRSPNNKAEALAFALAMKATREADPGAPLQDAIYFERLGRLLPTYGLSSHADDDHVLGYWLTGGARVSAKASRRLGQIMNWMGESHLDEVVSASGIAQTKAAPADHEREHPGQREAEPHLQEQRPPGGAAGTGFEEGRAFSLAGRPQLEAFFNEHVIDILRHKQRYASLGVGFPAAIALHGPPGCGKTFAVEQLVEFLGWPSFQIEASSVASPYIHETSKKVAEVFDKAMKSAPSVLVIDEMEAFLADRESGSGSSHHRVEEVAEFLRRIPEAAKNEVLVIGMTNRIQLIDPAILRRGRFDHVVAVDPATEEEIQALLDKLLRDLPTAEAVDTGMLARRLGGRPLSDVAFVVREGARRCARAGLQRIEQHLLLDAVDSATSRSEPGGGRRIGFI
jgi:cell division protease FtsH